MSPLQHPAFVSFVVATYNCVDRIPVLRRAVTALSDLPCEFCISDGGSTDGTIEALQNIPGVKIVRSGPDKGIYDAWNLILDECAGTYFSFIGVDDEPAREFIVRAMQRFSALEHPPSFVYGDALLKNGELYRRLISSDHPSLFESTFPRFDVAHPGALNHARLFKTEKFSANYRLAGDLEFYLRSRSQIKKYGYAHINMVQAVIDISGVSRSATAFTTYRLEYDRIKSELGLKPDYSPLKLRALGLLQYMPWLFKTLKRVNWALRGRARGAF